MRVFVTGSTGFVGTGVVKELLSAGHTVVGLTRSEQGAQQLKSQGAQPLHGSIEDVELLKKAASEADGVIHLAFNHKDFSQFAKACATDRDAITAMASTLAAAGGDRALVITSGTMMLTHGKLGYETDAPDAVNPFAAARGASETVCNDFAKQGVRTSVIRLPPTVHGPGSSGFAGMFVRLALQKGVSAYVGEGQNRWCAGHRDDAAKLYRLALEKGKPGSIYHAVAEESVTIKDIATEVGKQLDIPVISVPAEKAEEQFGWFQFGAVADNTASSKKTREELGWTPTGPGVVEDIPVIINYAKSQ